MIKREPFFALHRISTKSEIEALLKKHPAILMRKYFEVVIATSATAQR